MKILLTFILAIAFAISLIICMGSFVYIIASLIDAEVLFSYTSIPIFLASLISCVLCFKLGQKLDRIEKQKRHQEHYDKYINPDNADILEFSRKNPGVKICKFNKSDMSLAIIDERIWCAFEKRDGKILLFHSPDVEPHQINTKCIENINVKDLPRIS